MDRVDRKIHMFFCDLFRKNEEVRQQYIEGLISGADAVGKMNENLYSATSTSNAIGEMQEAVERVSDMLRDIEEEDKPVITHEDNGGTEVSRR